jgi:hypothetical protein
MIFALGTPHLGQTIPAEDRFAMRSPLRLYYLDSLSAEKGPWILMSRGLARAACGFFMGLLGLLAPLAAQAAAEATVTRVVMLPLPERTTVVVELSGPIAHVQEIQSDLTTVVFEAGPVAAGVQALDLKPTAPSSIVAGVTLGGAARPDGTNYVRIRITTRAAAIRQRRASGNRLYVDITAPEAPVVQVPAIDNPPLPSGPQRATSPPSIAAPPARQPTPQPDAPRPQATAKPSAPPSAADAAAYQALDASTRRRARELAARPDVKALLRLRDEVKQRDNELGQRRAELIEALLLEVDRYTDEARARQLELDRRAFLKNQ